jgi:hypothetical protein
MSWEGHATNTGKTKMHRKYLLKSIRGRDTLKDIPIGDKVI